MKLYFKSEEERKNFSNGQNRKTPIYSRTSLQKNCENICLKKNKKNTVRTPQNFPWLDNHVQLFGTPWTVVCPLHLWNSPGKNTGVGCHSLLQRILPTQLWHPSLPHRGQIPYSLSQQGSPIQMSTGV